MARSPRAALLACAQADGDVAEGALWLAAEECGSIDIAGSLARLGERADELRARGAHAGRPAAANVPVIAGLLADRLGLRPGDAIDPQAHYLHSVLATGRGIPIACSAVWIAVGRRAGTPVDGVGLPGHFVVRIGRSLVDAHGGG